MSQEDTRVVLYARVSLDEEGMQDPENQLVPMRQFVELMKGWRIVGTYIDYASGGSSNRPQFQEMLSRVRQRHADIVLVWALDRFSREGMINTLSYIKQLKKYNTALKSLQEQWLDTSESGVGELLLAIFSWVAEQERKRISERTKAGLEKARLQGKRLGRPPKQKGGLENKPILPIKECLKKRR